MFSLDIEILKLVVSAFVPALVAYFGWKINQNLKAIEQSQWQSRKIIEKRLQVYDELTPHLNGMYCFFMWRGDWKETTPDQAIHSKRIADKQVHIYRHLFPHSFYVSYNDYIHTLYRPFAGRGANAMLRTSISSVDGDRTTDCNYKWDNKWLAMFDIGNEASKKEIATAYEKLMSEFRTSLGLR